MAIDLPIPQNDDGHPIMYAVTKGRYSDFRVLALFTTMEKANNFILAHFGSKEDGNWDHVEITEYPVDPYSPYQNGLYPYTVTLNLKEGGVNMRRLELTDPDNLEEFQSGEGKVDLLKFNQSIRLELDLFAENMDHAAKVAEEKFRAVVAGQIFVYSNGKPHICTGVHTITRDQRNRLLAKPISEYRFEEALELAEKVKDASDSSETGREVSGGGDCDEYYCDEC